MLSIPIKKLLNFLHSLPEQTALIETHKTKGHLNVSAKAGSIESTKFILDSFFKQHFKSPN